MRLVLLSALLLVAPAAPVAPAVISSSRQLIVVVTPDWDDVRGELRRYERASTSDAWRVVGDVHAIVVGKSGTAWDPLAEQVIAGPVKREGDGRSPAGVFSLGTAFGYAPASEAAWLKLPYLHVTEGIECVDDASSASYNRIVNRRQVSAPDWTSSEKMREVGEAYRWGVAVNYNTPAVATRGSCIFLHIGGGPEGKGTAGCTAMPTADLRAVMAWLDPALTPVLVQLPRAAYEKLKRGWRLP